MNTSKANILLIYTGGTIGMIKDFKTGTLRAFDFKTLLEKIPELQLLDCHIDTVSFKDPIDSSNMKPEYWVQIAELIETNYNKFIEAIKKSFEGERLEKLLHMYSMEELGPNLMLSPASGNINYHNAYEGGYIDHVMNVARNSLRMMKLYKEAGGIVDFTQEELDYQSRKK